MTVPLFLSSYSLLQTASMPNIADDPRRRMESPEAPPKPPKPSFLTAKQEAEHTSTSGAPPVRCVVIALIALIARVALIFACLLLIPVT